MTPISPTGILIQKIQRQEKTVVMKPPSGGPITGPISAGMVSQASAEISSALGTERKMTRRPTGTIMAPPMPWMMRNRMKSGSDWAKPQAVEPSVSAIMAARNTVRAPKRSATQPLNGMKTASGKRYEEGDGDDEGDEIARHVAGVRGRTRREMGRSGRERQGRAVSRVINIW